MRFQHRAFLAADIGAGAAPKLDETGLDDARRLERGDLGAQDLQHRRIFVAHVEINALGLDRMGGDQRPFQRAVRIAFQIDAILERAGFALVAVDRHQPRAWIGAHELPFLAGRKAGSAKSAQAGVLHGAPSASRPSPRPCAPSRAS